MSNPYESLPAKAYWKPAVAQRSMFDISDIWDPKFHIQPEDNVVTFGSCFAQHIGRAMKARGFNWLCTETPPAGLTDKNSRLFNYNIFSARTGNIYTTTLLKQWTEWALGKKPIPDEVWEKDGRFYDAFRPRVEPEGFATREEARASLEYTVECFKQAIIKANYFVFTLGLTEGWINAEHGYEYPMCPGTVAGDFDPQQHKFHNLPFPAVITALRETMELMRTINPGLRFLLTVSPVPLTATKSGNHVVVATMYSKSVLRAVTGQLEMTDAMTDYFPSYEIINSPVFKGAFFEPNQRSVNPFGVNFVMDNFFKCLEGKFGKYQMASTSSQKNNVQDEVCEEELLEAFGR